MIKRGIILVTAIFLLLLGSVSAIDKGYCVTAEVSDIIPSSVGIGEEFTVGVQIENCGKEAPEYVSFELLNPPTDITIKEPLIINISDLSYANSERFITYHMRTDTNAQPGTYFIKTRLSYGDSKLPIARNYNITIDVVGDKAELSIASVKTDPILPYKGNTIEMTLRLENFGEGNAHAVRVYADHPFQGIKESFIGTLDSDEDGPAVFTFIADKSGDFEFPIKISYNDDFGDNEISTSVNLTILKKKIAWLTIILSIVIIALVVCGVFYYFRLKRTKNKIIHQLLQGNNRLAELEETATPKKHTKRHIRKSSKEKEEREKKEKIKNEFKREILEKYKK
jgi:hypothetical protein